MLATIVIDRNYGRRGVNLHARPSLPLNIAAGMRQDAAKGRNAPITVWRASNPLVLDWK
jgi:hypothetical protein